MDLLPNNQNFDLNKSRQKFHHSLKEHHKIGNIPKFRCEISHFVLRTGNWVWHVWTKDRFPLQPYRSIFFCVEVISSTLVLWKKEYATLRYDTVEVENGWREHRMFFIINTDRSTQQIYFKIFSIIFSFQPKPINIQMYFIYKLIYGITQ
jgi:hypothetical protein